jgi:glycosyltransferase involved in cell wall biosynthesis
LIDSLEPAAFADVMDRIVTDAALRERALQAGPSFVADKYEWSTTVTLMEKLYADVLAP